LTDVQRDAVIQVFTRLTVTRLTVASHPHSFNNWNGERFTLAAGPKALAEHQNAQAAKLLR
jgi:hypothetical protein